MSSKQLFETLSKSSITDVVLDDVTLPNILTINLDFNFLSGLYNFTKLHFRYITKTKLYLSAVNEFSFQLPNLINLSLKNNRIQVLGKTSLRFLKNLKSINLSGNPLYWVSPAAFWPNKALKQLYLNKTQLEYLTDEHLRPIDDFLDTLDLHEMPNLRMDPNIALSGVSKCLTSTTADLFWPIKQPIGDQYRLKTPSQRLPAIEKSWF